MARVPIPVTQVLGSVNPAMVVVATVDANDVDNHEWLMVDGDILLAFNTGAGGHIVVLLATPDGQLRSENSTQTVDGGELAVFGPLQSLGWKQTSGMVNVDTNDAAAEIKFGVVRGVE